MHTILLLKKTQEEEEKETEEFQKRLTKVSRYMFWQKHFENHNFRFEPEKFSWGYWQEIPFFNKDDFFKIGLLTRIADARIKLDDDPYKFILRVTSGTSGFAEPPLLLRSIGVVITEDEFRTLWAYGSFVLGLQGALIHIAANRKDKSNRFHALVLTHDQLNPEALEGVRDFFPDSMSGFPNDLASIATEFLGRSVSVRNEISNGVKKIYIGGDFIGRAQLSLLKSAFSSAAIISEYGLSEFGKVGRPCEFLKERYGFNAYHPGRDKHLFELSDIDEDGYGEIIGTNLTRPELALIRYRTGDIGKVIEEKCSCGDDFTLILIGRKNFDYVKCAGAMIVRQELERVMEKFKDYIEEWRAEAREFNRFNSVIGELTLKIKPTSSLNSQQDILSSLAGQISSILYLTPTDTLMGLTQKQKFLPLKLEITSEFPRTPKRVLIQRVLT